jgi:hypothetical protein
MTGDDAIFAIFRIRGISIDPFLESASRDVICHGGQRPNRPPSRLPPASERNIVGMGRYR